MPRRLLLLGVSAVAVVMAASASSSSLAPPRLKGPPQVLAQFGYVKSLKPQENAFELRFDAAQWLGGATARRAAVEDEAIRPGASVPNDYYILNSDRRLTTYRVPKSAPVTVVTSGGGGLRSTTITAAELAEIVRGKNPRGRPLMDRQNALGFWVRTRIDTVRSIDQQYQP